jgi:midasin
MFLDWIHNSTLGDFEARLWSGHLLAQFLTVIDNKNQLSELSTRINSILAHYEQFTLPIQTKYSELYKPIETEMLNFMNVVRYTDLNLWSVHDSVKRAHAQLFRILRKFKVLFSSIKIPYIGFSNSGNVH